MRLEILILSLFELYFEGFCQFDQGVLLTGNNPLRLGKSFNRTRFIIQCQPLNNGSGFKTITAIRIARAREFTPFEDVVSIRTGQNNLKWQDDSVRQRTDVRQVRLGQPNLAFIRYEIPPSRTDCTDAAYYRCIIDGTTLRFERVVFIQPQIEESYIESLTTAPPNVGIGNTVLQGTNRSVYTVGTSVWLHCSARTGNPPFPLRWCIDSGNGQFTQYITNTTRDFTSNGIGESERCILTKTSITTYVITERDVDRNIRLRCEIVDFNRLPCSSRTDREAVRDVIISGVNDNPPSTTVTNSPVIIIDTGIVDIPSSTTPGRELSSRLGNLSDNSGGSEVTLIVGAVLIVIAIVCIAGGLFCMLKARKVKQEAELAITRSTYDALNNKPITVEMYHSLTPDDARTRTLQMDNEGYVLARQ